MPSRARSCNARSEEHTSELQSRRDLVCRLLLEKKKYITDCLYGGIVPARRSIDIYPFALFDLQVSLFFFNDPATNEIYTLSQHDALPITHSVADGFMTRRQANSQARVKSS